MKGNTVTILSDGTIRRLIAAGNIGLEPFDPSMIQPASADFRLDKTMLVINEYAAAAIDPYDIPDNLYRQVEFTEKNPFYLHPGQFALGASAELLSLADDLVARCEGKSSLGRLGLMIHVTAGFVDPGWKPGQITLELRNVGPLPILLRPGMKIGQFSFERLDAPAEKPYGHPDLNSKYVGQRGPVASRYYGNAHTPPPAVIPGTMTLPGL